MGTGLPNLTDEKDKLFYLFSAVKFPLKTNFTFMWGAHDSPSGYAKWANNNSVFRMRLFAEGSSIDVELKKENEFKNEDISGVSYDQITNVIMLQSSYVEWEGVHYPLNYDIPTLPMWFVTDNPPIYSQIEFYP